MHRSSSLFAFLVILLAAGSVEPSAAIAQIVDYPQTRDADGVQATIQQLFDGMRAGDSTMVRAVIHPQARFQTTLTRDGRSLLHTGSVDEFIAAVGTPHDEVWDERIDGLEIRVDDNLAQAWMQYWFYLGDEFSHCGVNALQLFWDGEKWQIVQIIDTRRRECEGMRDGR